MLEFKVSGVAHEPLEDFRCQGRAECAVLVEGHFASVGEERRCQEYRGEAGTQSEGRCAKGCEQLVDAYAAALSRLEPSDDLVPDRKVATAGPRRPEAPDTALAGVDSWSEQDRLVHGPFRAKALDPETFIRCPAQHGSNEFATCLGSL